MYLYIHIYIYTSVCACVCACTHVAVFVIGMDSIHSFVQSEHTEIVEALQLADTTKALLEQEKEYYRGETEKMHSRLLLLGEEIALTPATLLFTRGQGRAMLPNTADATPKEGSTSSEQLLYGGRSYVKKPTTLRKCRTYHK